LVFAGVLIAVGWATSSVAQDVASGSGGPLGVISMLLGVTSLLGIPVAVGVAILRYHLYDIDLVINRTLVYATLTIAALFNPLRRRIQGFIDRRFYRRKYHARNTLAGFSSRLRDETDLDALNDELVAIVR
jgi:hypothetical protein